MFIMDVLANTHYFHNTSYDTYRKTDSSAINDFFFTIKEWRELEGLILIDS